MNNKRMMFDNYTNDIKQFLHETIKNLNINLEFNESNIASSFKPIFS